MLFVREHDTDGTYVQNFTNTNKPESWDAVTHK